CLRLCLLLGLPPVPTRQCLDNARHAWLPLSERYRGAPDPTRPAHRVRGQPSRGTLLLAGSPSPLGVSWNIIHPADHVPTHEIDIGAVPNIAILISMRGKVQV